MKSRIAFFTLLGIVSLALLTFRTQVVRQSGPGAGEPGVSRTAALSAASSDPASLPLLPKSRSRETELERRARMLSDQDNRDDFKLSEHELYLYLQANSSNALSLVTAFESSRDREYLRIAAQRFPDDPFVQAKVVIHDALPAERDQAIEAFKKADPNNALANLFAAREAMKKGNLETAIAEIAAAKDKSYNEYSVQSMQGLEEAYLSAGRSPAEAKALGSAEITLPHLAQLKSFGREFLDLAEKNSDDRETQLKYLTMNWQIGQNFHSSEQNPLITTLVGIAMQNATLGKWPADVPFGTLPAADVLKFNGLARNEIRTVGPIFEKWFYTAPEDEVVAYFDLIKTEGELGAASWLKQKHPELALTVPPRN